MERGEIAQRSYPYLHPGGDTLVTQAAGLYVHASDDGGIFAIDGSTGQESWITVTELENLLAALRGSGRAVLVSGDTSASISRSTLNWIRETGLPVVVAAEVHPHATRPNQVTSLMVAAYDDDMVALADLLSHGVAVDVADDCGWTALMYGANAG